MQAGDAQLVVRAPRRVDLQIVPADADPFLRLMAARVYARALPEAPARFQVAPGGYLLVGEAGIVLRAVEVGAAGAEITLD